MSLLDCCSTTNTFYPAQRCVVAIVPAGRLPVGQLVTGSPTLSSSVSQRMKVSTICQTISASFTEKISDDDESDDHDAAPPMLAVDKKEFFKGAYWTDVRPKVKLRL